MNVKYLYVYTIGCQMNVYDSEMFGRVLRPMGYIPAETLEDADLIIVNTCSVRKKAEEKAFSFLGRLQSMKLKNPELVVAIGGCVAQQEGANIVSRMPWVDIVFGTRAVGRLPDIIKRFEESGTRVIDVTMDPVQIEALPPKDLDTPSPVSTFVTIMRGCDNFCSYCIVPYVRGRETSRSPENIIREIEALVERGTREVTLLGQNVNSYGLKEGICSFPDLLRQVNGIKNLERIRFATSHPKDLSDDLIRTYAELEKLCNHIHLPVQSGSDRLLERMNRKYTRAIYIERIEKLRTARQNMAVTSDMIVGFPGETDEDFDMTLELIKTIGYDGLFAFKYSDRPHAPAVDFPDKVPEDVKKNRLEKLLKLEKSLSQMRNDAYLGRVEPILVDGRSKKIGETGLREWAGRTSSNKVVNFNVPDAMISNDIMGKIVEVRIEQCRPHSLKGTWVKTL
ncbi:MAG: tRNA (N6-isopentenyl adenosine(37)-C2)-methylthiotransferase MiaB [Proteobacteria bacterium]|nr:tRNA (N6-isopentenyl adenosine(37)-C2)-methylthiotransferase MiaB [Pseudomonadota bacterium]